MYVQQSRILNIMIIAGALWALRDVAPRRGIETLYGTYTRCVITIGLVLLLVLWRFQFLYKNMYIFLLCYVFSSVWLGGKIMAIGLIRPVVAQRHEVWL